MLAQRHDDRGTAPEAEPPRRAAARQRDFEPLGAAEQRAQRVRIALRVCGHHATEDLPTRGDLDVMTPGESIEDRLVNVGHQIAKSIDPKYLSEERLAFRH